MNLGRMDPKTSQDSARLELIRHQFPFKFKDRSHSEQYSHQVQGCRLLL